MTGLAPTRRWVLAIIGAIALFSSGCAVRDARARPAPVQSVNPRTTVAGSEGEESMDAAPGAGARTGPARPDIMIVQPDGVSLREQRDIDAWSADVTSREEQLTVALSSGGGPNCSAAREHLRAICELAERICDIAERHPSEADLSSRCEESRSRCSERTEEVQRRCGGT